MSQGTPESPRRGGWLVYTFLILVTAGLSVGVTALLMNIYQRKDEARSRYLQVVEVDEKTDDPEVWGRNFPRQYASYLLTAENTTHGGSDGMPPSKLENDPRLVGLFSGYPVAVDFREKRGHAFMLVDQKQTERVKQFQQTGACLHCHSSVLPLYREEGSGDLRKGFEKVCSIPLQKGFAKVSHPVTCLDCHDPKTMTLRVLRPAFVEGIAALAGGDAPVPHLPSIERWRKGDRKTPYDPNAHASRQEMRSFVCGQCHVEYYFKAPGILVTYPWARGLKMDDIEAYYDAAGFTDWVHGKKKDGSEFKSTDGKVVGGSHASMLKAQHPEFELWSQGVHARSGVACADCHMPYVREGAVKVSDHNVRSPMLMAARACQTCHRYSEQEMAARTRAIQDRNRALMGRAEDAVLALIDAVKTARQRGATEQQLEAAKKLHRKAHWRLDFVNAENSMGFHAPQEAARILGEAIDYARQGQIEALKLPGK
jgi:nitrite reductase (cytochrome c-552)